MLGMDYYQDESIRWMMIKTEGKRTSAAMPGIFLYCPNLLDVVGAVTPVASEVISLLLVRILQECLIKLSYFLYSSFLCCILSQKDHRISGDEILRVTLNCQTTFCQTTTQLLSTRQKKYGLLAGRLKFC